MLLISYIKFLHKKENVFFVSPISSKHNVYTCDISLLHAILKGLWWRETQRDDNVFTHSWSFPCIFHLQMIKS